MALRREMAEPVERLAELARRTRDGPALEFDVLPARLAELLRSAFAQADGSRVLRFGRGAGAGAEWRAALEVSTGEVVEVPVTHETITLLTDARYTLLVELHSEIVACTRLACPHDTEQCARAALGLAEVYVAHDAPAPALEHAMRAEMHVRRALDAHAASQGTHGAADDTSSAAIAGTGLGAQHGPAAAWSGARELLVRSLVIQGSANTQLRRYSFAAENLEAAQQAVHARLGPSDERNRPILHAQAVLAVATAAVGRARELIELELQLARASATVEDREIGELEGELANLLLLEAAALEVRPPLAELPPRDERRRVGSTGRAERAQPTRGRAAGVRAASASGRARRPASVQAAAATLPPSSLPPTPPPTPPPTAPSAGAGALAGSARARPSQPGASPGSAESDVAERVHALRCEAAALLERVHGSAEPPAAPIGPGADGTRASSAVGRAGAQAALRDAKPPATGAGTRTSGEQLGLLEQRAKLSALLGHWEAAERAYLGVAVALEEEHGMAHPRVADAWLRVAEARLQTQRIGAAARDLRHVRTLRRTLYGAGSAQETQCVLALAELHAQRREWKRSRALLAAALTESRALDRDSEAEAANQSKPALRWGWNGAVPEADSGGRLLAKCVHAYIPEQARRETHLELSAGDVLEVLPHDRSGTPRLSTPWSLGSARGRTGWFPSSYVRHLPAEAPRSERTERLLEALARVLEREQIDGSASGGGSGGINYEAVAALLHAERSGERFHSPLPAVVLGQPAPAVLGLAGRGMAD